MYWVVNFIEGGFTLLTHNIETLNRTDLDNLLPLLHSNTTFSNYIDIQAEYTAMKMLHSAVSGIKILINTCNSHSAFRCSTVLTHEIK